MSDLRSIVDRELERVELRPFTLEGFHRRRDRKRRNQRIAAGGVGVAVALVLIAALVGTSVFRSSRIPASTPSPTNAMHIAGHNGGLTWVNQGGRGAGPGIAIGAHLPRVLVSGLGFSAFDWSPDGSELAYMVTRSHACSLWVLDVGSGQSSKLSSCESDRSPPASIDWAPDGTRLAFASGGEIDAIAPDGTKKTYLAAGSSPMWSPNGERIAFLGGSGYLYVAAENGDNAQLIGVAETTAAAAWSPDGASIAVTRQAPGPRDTPCRMCDNGVLEVWLIRLDGSGEMKLATQHGCCIGAWPTLGWSPDGSMIALTGVRVQLIDVATGASWFGKRQGMVVSVRPSWRPVR